MNKRKINIFAKKWLKEFKNQNINYIKLIDHHLGDECREIGFVMDCGDSFSSIYGKAVYDVIELNKVINIITDVDMLGSALYSRWRYFSHWAYDSKSILELENISWFEKILERLIILTED